MDSLSDNPDPTIMKNLLESCSEKERQEHFHAIMTTVLDGLVNLPLITPEDLQMAKGSTSKTASQSGGNKTNDGTFLYITRAIHT